MYANSKVPTSAQSEIHEHLPALLQRHASAPFQKPFADYNVVAFRESIERWRQVAPGAPLILDSCCGTGESSVRIARDFPDHYVIAVDQSLSRLQRRSGGWCNADDLPPNLDMVRADLIDYWRLLDQDGIKLARHYLLYPNPWPKIGHLHRRWHGHPVFFSLLKLGGRVECRSNWKIYTDEFAFAVEQTTHKSALCERFIPADPITAFERKYRDSGHDLYRVVVDLDGEGTV